MCLNFLDILRVISRVELMTVKNFKDSIFPIRVVVSLTHFLLNLSC